MRAWLVGLTVAAGLALAAVSARAETFRLASLEWPPYAGAALPGQGSALSRVRRAFEAAGAAVAFDFLPWERAVRSGMEARGFVGYGPEYYDPLLDARAEGTRCLFSRPFQTGPLGLMIHAETSLAWQEYEDLKGLTIGTVRGYLNTPRFDRLAAQGELHVDPVVDDRTNVLKVAGKRVDAAVIDPNVLGYLLLRDPALAAVAGQVKIADRLLAKKTLHICFRDTVVGARARAIFHAGLDAM